MEQSSNASNNKVNRVTIFVTNLSHLDIGQGHFHIICLKYTSRAETKKIINDFIVLLIYYHNDVSTINTNPNFYDFNI